MKIRIMGTKEECGLAKKYYQELERSDENVRCMTISDLYPNRAARRFIGYTWTWNIIRRY